MRLFCKLIKFAESEEAKELTELEFPGPQTADGRPLKVFQDAQHTVFLKSIARRLKDFLSEPQKIDDPDILAALQCISSQNFALSDFSYTQIYQSRRILLLRKIRNENARYEPAILDLSQTGDLKIIKTKFGNKLNELSCPIAAVPFFSAAGQKYFVIASLLYDKPLQIFAEKGCFIRTLGGREFGGTSTLFSADQRVYVADDYTGVIRKFNLSDVSEEKLEWTASEPFSPVESPEEKQFILRKVDFMTVSEDLLYVSNVASGRIGMYRQDTGEYVSGLDGRSEKYAEYKIDDMRFCPFLFDLPPLSELVALTQPVQNFNSREPSNEFALVGRQGTLIARVALDKSCGQLRGAAVDRRNGRLLLAVEHNIYVYTAYGLVWHFLAPGCESNILNLGWQTENDTLLIFYGGAATNQVVASLTAEAVNRLLLVGVGADPD